MKKVLFVFVLGLVAISAYSQDLTDEKNFHTLKNLKLVSKSKKAAKYSIILNNNMFLDVNYNILVADQYNAQYTLFEVTNDLMESSDPLHNYKYVLSHIDYLCSVLNLSTVEKSKIKKLITQNKAKFNKNDVLIPITFLKGYDEVDLTLNNHVDSMLISFDFIRYL